MLPALTVYVVLLVAIPSELVVAALGAAGTPAGLLAAAMLLWWVGGAIAARTSPRYSNPVKWLLLGFAMAIVLSYLFGMSRPVATDAEVSSADRGLLSLCGWLGIALVIADGVRSKAALDTLLRRIIAGGALIAALGILQFFFNLDLAHVIHIPGLTANGAFGEIIQRSTFRRVTGTASHPIEFGVVLATLLPLAVHYARYASDPSVRRRLWVAVFLMAGALPLSVARSGIIGFAVALAVMFFTWPHHFKRRVLLFIGVGVVGLSVVVPGLIGTFRGLFLNASTDPSVGGRSDDYGPVLRYVEQTPVFGRGFGTFIPSLYRTLDNAYLGLLVETGVVGLAAVISLFAGAIIVTARCRAKDRSSESRDLRQSLVAAIAVLAVNAFAFDLLGFSMCAGLLFVLIGCSGAMYALQTSGQMLQTSRLTVRGRTLTAVLFCAVAAGGVFRVAVSPTEYDATGSVILDPPSSVTAAPFSRVGRASTAASLIHDVIESDDARQRLRAQGVENFDVAIGDGSLMAGTDRFGTGGAVLNIVVRSPSAASAEEGLRAVKSALAQDLSNLQSTIGVPDTERIQLSSVTTNPAFLIKARSSRALVASFLVALVAGWVLVHILRRLQPFAPKDAVPRVEMIPRGGLSE